MKVCVYCASSARAPSRFGEAAYVLGRELARADIEVMFGGGGIGSMAQLADGVLDHGGQIVGVMPGFMRELEWAHPRVETFCWTPDLASRKAKLIENTDGIVALPGGSGTFEELIETITHKRLGLYLQPIVIVNQDGFYDPLIALFEAAIQNQFMDQRHMAMFSVVDNVHDVIPAIRSAPRWSAEARGFATLR